jgi:methyl-accepting chemotaxis protein
VKLSNVKISQRLVGTFGLLGVLLATSAAVAITSSRAQQRATERVSAGLDVAHDAMQVKFRAADLNGWQTAYAFDVATGADTKVADGAGSRKAFLDSVASFRTELATLTDHELTSAERASLDDVTASLAKFMALDERIAASYRNGDATAVAEAHALVAGEEIAIFNAMAASIDDMLEHVDADAEAAAASASAASSRAQSFALVSGLVSLALALLLARVVTRSITRPLGQLRERLVQIADGDGDLTQRLDEDRRDELGAVGGAFNRFVGKIASTVRTIGDHSVVIASASEELSAVSKEMAGNAGQTSQQATNSSSTAEQMSASVQTVAAATEQMTAAIGEIARGASEAARVAAQAGTLADAAQSTMARLGSSSQQIDEVARLIGGIAEQTNLLALNATIEAARAGEAGKGFAVVANEVKDLANRSGGATADISRQIATIQSDVQAAVGSIADIVLVIDQINETFTAIAVAVEEQTATTTEISRNLLQISAGASNIATDVTSVARSASEATQGAADTERAAEELSSMAGELQNLVGSFRT